MDISMKTYIGTYSNHLLYIKSCRVYIDYRDSVIGHNLTRKNINLLKYIIFYIYINGEQYINFTMYDL